MFIDVTKFGLLKNRFTRPEGVKAILAVTLAFNTKALLATTNVVDALSFSSTTSLQQHTGIHIH